MTTTKIYSLNSLFLLSSAEKERVYNNRKEFFENTPFSLTTDSSTAGYLIPTEIFNRIFYYVYRRCEVEIEDDKGQRQIQVHDCPETFFRLRQVCKGWKILIDDHILPSILNKISHIFSSFPSFERIKRTNFIGGITPCKTFETLSSRIVNFFPQTDSSQPIKRVTCLREEVCTKQFERLQDQALIQLWTSVLLSHPQLNFGDSKPNLQGSEEEIANQIRCWFNNSKNAQIIQQITTLNSDGNNVKPSFLIIPPEIGLLTSLETLNLSNHSFETLPESIGKLTNLKTLLLENIPLVELPPQLESLKALKTLYLVGCSLKEFPQVICKLEELEQLNLSSRNPYFAGSDRDHKKKKRVSDNQIETLPKEIENLSKLTRLSLRECGLKELPSVIGALPKLYELNVGRNDLSSLPIEIGSLSELRWLYLDDNDLTEIPAIGDLKKLEQLDVSKNLLVTLPKEIAEMSSIRGVGCEGIPSLLNLRNYVERRDSITYALQLFPLERFKNAFTYSCKTPLATVCQSILCSHDDAKLRENLSKLPKKTLEQITQKLGGNFEEMNPIDRVKLNQALTLIFREKWEAIVLSGNGKSMFVEASKMVKDPTLSDTSLFLLNLYDPYDLQYSKGFRLAEENILLQIDAVECTQPKKPSIFSRMLSFFWSFYDYLRSFFSSSS